jgi:hypothetical protein
VSSASTPRRFATVDKDGRSYGVMSSGLALTELTIFIKFARIRQQIIQCVL